MSTYNYHNNNHKGDDYDEQLDSDLKKIICPLLANADKDKNIVLLTTGAFNPIHRMHLEILNIAYKYLLSEKYNVLCAFISPSADCYVKHKRNPFIPFDIRCKIIQESIQDFYNEKKGKDKEMLKIYLNTWEGSHSYFIDFPEVIYEIQNHLNNIDKKTKIQLVYVCGMDHYAKCYNSFEKNVIVVDRKPYASIKFEDNPKKLIYIVKDENAEAYSSTAIKEAFEKGDLEKIKESTFPSAYQMIIEFFENSKKNNKENKKEKGNDI